MCGVNHKGGKIIVLEMPVNKGFPELHPGCPLDHKGQNVYVGISEPCEKMK